MKGFIVDGLAWEHHCQIRRVADMTPSDISGPLLDLSYFNDVKGTYLTYEITVAVPMGERDDYAALWDLLTDPADAHAFTVPYGNSSISVTARIAQISDEFYPVVDGAYWLARSFTIISNYPSKFYSLGEVVTRGMAPGPDMAAPAVGETLTWDGTAWVEASSWPDADTTYY